MNSQTTIGLDEVAHMAQLSRLKVSQDEQARFATQFGDILNYMNILQEVDVRGVEPLYSPAEHNCATRIDAANNVRSHKDALCNAPKADEQYFIVPKIV
ncbi:MAG: Asp-tRNA(Asn)/Glu-tRNA(Gln) amidotransferase subunit GatC [Desulfovibrionaceae bacterium]|nr:Asp-tRNA(Asn)/Glu-tRNA(Gln) amidotransferase subunit GatC [Desulfovibrionaceae bacterium]